MNNKMIELYKKLIYSTFFGNFCMERGIFIILLLSKGMTISQVAIWQATLNVGMFVSEVPTGFIADVFGKKKSLIIGKILYILYYYILIFYTDYNMLIFAAICFGVGSTFITGCDESLLYDIILYKDSEVGNKSSEYLGKFSAVTIIAVGISMVFGGFVQKFSWNILLTLSIVSQILSIVFVSKISLNTKKDYKTTEVLNKYKVALLYEMKHKNTLIFILILGLNIGVISALYILSQDEFVKFGYETFMISVFFAVDSVLSFALLYNLDKIKGVFKNQVSMIMISIISIIFLFILRLNIDFLFMFSVLAISILNNYLMTIMVDILYKMLDQDVRTTMISIFNAISALIMAVVFVFISKINTDYIVFIVITGALSYTFIIFYILYNFNLLDRKSDYL